MTIETANFINQLNTSFPRGTDLLKEGDDHIRMIKNVLKSTFPLFTGKADISSETLTQFNNAALVTSGGITFKTGFTVSGGQNVIFGGNKLQGIGDAQATGDAVSLGYLMKNVFNNVYPVGSLYLTTASGNPSAIFGGTWEQKAPAQYLMGSGSENVDGILWNVGANSSGGNHGFTIGYNQMPRHSHGIGDIDIHGSIWTGGAGAHRHSLPNKNNSSGSNGAEWIRADSFGDAGGVTNNARTNDVGNHSHAVGFSLATNSTRTDDQGGTERNGYTPRFYVINVWRRTGLA